jgi:hypothetical protein
MTNFENPYMERWQDSIKKLSDAMNANDIQATEKYKQECDEIYSKYKEYADNMYSCNGFAMCNEAIRQALPELFKTNRKAVKEIMTLIKEDKNLSAQFMFYQLLENCKTENVKEYVNEALNLVKNKIDLNTIQESNDKLASLAWKYGIIPNNEIDLSKSAIFESCEYLLKNKKKVNNLNEYTDKINSVCKYVTVHHKDTDKDKDVFGVMEEYNKKYNDLLNEEEKSFVQEIIDSQRSSNLEKQKKMFEALKNECLKGVNELLEQGNANESAQLTAIKENIMSLNFNEETMIKDVAKMLEIRDILIDKN